jgi:hypothetical protein
MYSARTRRLARNSLVSLLVFLALCAPALAQVDIEGSWRPLARNQDGSGMVGDIVGVPVTEGDRKTWL